MKFIRLDVKGEWMGTEHISGRGGLGHDDEEYEAGISCFQLDDVAFALENLRNYWVETVGVEDFSDMQITIFEGELLPELGMEMEDLATCENTLFEFDAEGVMNAIIEKHDEYFWLDEISEEEYHEFLSTLIA